MGSMAIGSEAGLEEFVIVNDGVKMQGDKAVKYFEIFMSRRRLRCRWLRSKSEQGRAL